MPGGGSASLALSTMGGIGLWSVVVSLPTIQAEFGVDRGGASLPYTATMVGFAVGGVLMGRLADRFGILLPLLIGARHAGPRLRRRRVQATSYWQFILTQAVLIGMLGSSATFGPLVADMSHWFRRRRGIAVAIVASGNYLAGTIWPPLLQHAIDARRLAPGHLGIGVLCLVTMLPLALLLCGGAPRRRCRVPHRARAPSRPGCRMSPATLQALLVLAGRRLLRRDVDAAGAHRRLLRRSRLRAGARRRDAVADAGFRAWSAASPPA